MLRYILLFFWTLLFIVSGIIKNLFYSQVLYIYKDLKNSSKINDLNSLDYITLSRKLMQGHKLDLFILKLSFIGWEILCIFLPIGYIWLIPYKQMTYMAFYKQLSQKLTHEKNACDY